MNFICVFVFQIMYDMIRLFSAQSKYIQMTSKSHGTIFTIFWQKKPHHFVERTHQIFNSLEGFHHPMLPTAMLTQFTDAYLWHWREMN